MSILSSTMVLFAIYIVVWQSVHGRFQLYGRFSINCMSTNPASAMSPRSELYVIYKMADKHLVNDMELKTPFTRVCNFGICEDWSQCTCT